jgi:hypothetical protein
MHMEACERVCEVVNLMMGKAERRADDRRYIYLMGSNGPTMMMTEVGPELGRRDMMERTDDDTQARQAGG